MCWSAWEKGDALEVLRTGRERLQQQAAAIRDEAVRERFLGQVEFAEFLKRTANLPPAPRLRFRRRKSYRWLRRRIRSPAPVTGRPITA